MRKFIAVFLTLIFLFSGCSSQPVDNLEHTMPKNQTSEEETKSSLDEEETVTEAVSLPGTSEPVGTDATEASSSFQPSVQPQTPETDSTVPVAPSEPQNTAKPVAKEPAETEPETERETTPPPKSTKETAPPKSETVPSVQSVPETKAEPKTTPDPAFDIGYWIGFAKSYAQSVGLVLSPDATECWDNPTNANVRCIYLERDLSSRLNRYAGDEDITDVWIWYEDLGGGEYLIYIGYA